MNLLLKFEILFYLKNSKQITEGLIKNHLSNIGLA